MLFQGQCTGLGVGWSLIMFSLSEFKVETTDIYFFVLDRKMKSDLIWKELLICKNVIDNVCCDVFSRKKFKFKVNSSSTFPSRSDRSSLLFIQ